MENIAPEYYGTHPMVPRHEVFLNRAHSSVVYQLSNSRTYLLIHGCYYAIIGVVGILAIAIRFIKLVNISC